MKQSRVTLWVTGIAVLVGTVLLFNFIRGEWAVFRNNLSSYQGVTIGQTKSEVLYAIGTPDTVQGPLEVRPDGTELSSPLLLNPAADSDHIPFSYDPVPIGKSAEEYHNWHYWTPESIFTVNFDSKNGKVSSIDCIPFDTLKYKCEPIFGIVLLMTEDKVIEKLGTPDENIMLGGGVFLGSPVFVTKHLYYKDIGVRIILREKRVSGIQKLPHTDPSFLSWTLRKLTK